MPPTARGKPHLNTMNDSPNEAKVTSSSSKLLGHSVKLLVSIGLFTLIFRTVNVHEVLRVVSSSNPWWLLPALVMQILSALIAAMRWYMIMHELNFGKGLPFYIRSYFKGTFFNQALPTSIGGDAMRVLETAKVGGGKREAFYGVFIDRIIGLLGLLLLNLVAILVKPVFLEKGYPAVHYIIIAIALCGFAGVAMLVLLGNVNWLTRYRITRLVHNLSNRVRTVYRSGKTIFKQLTLSIIIHLLSMMAVFFISLSVGLDYGLLIFLVVVPPVIMLTIIPVSLAGWGVRESGMIGLFLLIGADKATILSMSLIYGLTLVIASIPGLFFFITGRQHHSDRGRP